MNYRDFLQKVIYVIINPIIKAMIRLHITPQHCYLHRFHRQYRGSWFLR